MHTRIPFESTANNLHSQRHPAIYPSNARDRLAYATSPDAALAAVPGTVVLQHVPQPGGLPDGERRHYGSVVRAVRAAGDEETAELQGEVQFEGRCEGRGDRGGCC